MLDWLEKERLLPVLFFTFNRRSARRSRWRTDGVRCSSPRSGAGSSILFEDLVERYECAETASLARLRTMAAAGVRVPSRGHASGAQGDRRAAFSRRGSCGCSFATETFAARRQHAVAHFM